LHFGGDDNSLEDFASDGDATGEGAFLIDVVAFDGFLGSFEVEADVLEVSNAGAGLLGEQLLAIEEDGLLFLEGSFVLS
jgi:hypothetical protein